MSLLGGAALPQTGHMTIPSWDMRHLPAQSQASGVAAGSLLKQLYSGRGSGTQAWVAAAPISVVTVSGHAPETGVWWFWLRQLTHWYTSNPFRLLLGLLQNLSDMSSRSVPVAGDRKFGDWKYRLFWRAWVSYEFPSLEHTTIWAPQRQVVLSKVMPSLSASLVKFDGLLSAEAARLSSDSLINHLIWFDFDWWCYSM